MGYCAEPTPEMGEYSVEVRSESFYLRGEDTYGFGPPKPCPERCDVVGTHHHGGEPVWVKQKHAIYVYPVPVQSARQGTIELLIEDIPKIRAALDQAERIAAGNKLPTD
jgi:hypothetical protein